MPQDPKRPDFSFVSKQLGRALSIRIAAYEDQLVELRKKELAKASVQMARHAEPGVHEAAGSPHTEPGVHEKFADRVDDVKPAKIKKHKKTEKDMSSAKKSETTQDPIEFAKKFGKALNEHLAKAAKPVASPEVVAKHDPDPSTHHYDSAACPGCSRTMNPVEVLLAGAARKCAKCLKPAVLKNEDVIDGKNETDAEKRIKTLGPTADAVLPSDGIKEVEASGSGGSIKKNPLKKEEMAAAPGGKPAATPKVHSAKPAGIPGAPKAPGAPGMTKSEHGWKCLACTHEGKGEAPKKCPKCDSERDDRHGPHPIDSVERDPDGIGHRVKKSEQLVKAGMSGMGKMPKDMQALASADSHKTHMAGTTPPAPDPKAQAKPPAAYDAAQYMPAPKVQAPAGVISPVKHALSKLKAKASLPMAPMSRVVNKAEDKAEMCKSCGKPMDKAHAC